MQLLCCFVHYNSNLATIVATRGAYSVVDVISTTVRAYCQCGSYSLVMGTTLSGTSVRLSSFRMCHNSINYFNNLQFTFFERKQIIHFSLFTFNF